MDGGTTRLRSVVTASLIALLVVSAAGTLPAVALEPDSGSTYVQPRAPGASGEYTVTVTAEENDTITKRGLQRLTLDFSADPDFSGSVANVTARDVRVRIRKQNSTGTRPAGPVTVMKNPADTAVTITLQSTATQINAGDQIVVHVRNVTNSAIAAPNPQSARQFALDVTAVGPRGQTDGPIDARYELDPNATGPNTPSTTANSQPAPPATSPAPTSASPTTETNNASTAGGAAEMNETAQSTSKMAGTATTPTTERSSAGSTPTGSPASTAQDAGGERTRTTPGFGVVVALIALIAAGLVVARWRG